MSDTIIADLDLWLASIVAGACMAFAYDLLRLFRRLVRHGRLAVDVEDLLYWTICFFVSFALLYYGNNGVIRFVAVFGAALGMLLYVVTVGRFFVKAGYFLINKTIGSAFRFLGRILRKIHKIICFICRKITEIFKNVGIIHKIRKIRQYLLTHCIFYNTIKKNRGFFTAQKGEGGSSRGRKCGTRRIKKRIKKKKDAGV
ncbi:MAG: spore cortex biosynthesis protein YabQ [Lachnospiraceae bacterium]|nr:spore cortex biosynthesis protein YabQ [Lachnospiraceae bacterium]